MPHRLYTDLAWLWPMLSPPEHYQAEAATLRELIDRHFADHPAQRSARPALLELGAGGGHTLCHLADDFNCVAVDLSEPMLANCRRLAPGVETVADDMRSARLGRRFDVVLLHDAVDYMTTPDDARAAMATVAEHLAPGGVAFIAPTYTRETFIDGDVADDGTSNRDADPAPGCGSPPDADAPDLTYFSYIHDPDPADTTCETILLYLIRDARTRQVQVVEDRHICGLFSNDDWLSFLAGAGLDARLHEQERGAWSLFVAVPRK